MNVLMVGDVVGSPGRTLFARVATRLKANGGVDFVVVNAENAAGGRGLTGELAEELFAAGADVITLGDHVWNQKDMETYIAREGRVLRPANLAPGCPGKGIVTCPSPAGNVTVILLVGRVFMAHTHDCPFRTVDALLAQARGAGAVVLVELHAEATSEKIVLGRYLDGRVSAVVGTHTHVQTSDEAVLPRGTAFITDLGMTGPKDSALGRDLESVTRMFLTGMPTPFKVARDDIALEGVVIEIDEATGRARSIRRVRERQ